MLSLDPIFSSGKYFSATAWALHPLRVVHRKFIRVLDLRTFAAGMKSLLCKTDEGVKIKARGNDFDKGRGPLSGFIQTYYKHWLLCEQILPL